MDTIIKKNKIAILIPYFGKWPAWIDLYLFSCQKNNFIDWYFFTDCEVKESKDNIFFHQISFNDYCQVIRERLKISFNPASAYKLCDVKPYYGYIHAEIISEYQFWGFGDIDLVWGNIKSFYTDLLLTKYDVFSTHSDRISGHLAIFRNNKKYREIGFKIKDYRYKLEYPTYLGLDEFELSNLIYPASKYIRKIYSKILRPYLGWRNAWVVLYTIMPYVNYLLCTRGRKLYFYEQHTTPILSDDGYKCKHDADSWYYKNGEVTNNKTSQKYIYLHFMILKKNSFRKIYYWKDDFFSMPKESDYEKGVVITKQGIAEL